MRKVAFNGYFDNIISRCSFKTPKPFTFFLKYLKPAVQYKELGLIKPRSFLELGSNINYV